MEPIRHHEPKPGFLEGVRKIANQIGATLIFDEVTSGWRMNVGGIHLLYNVIPDIVVFGKAMGNGYPMAAIIGKQKVMESAQESFISSTFWTEGIGLVASIATIHKCIDKKVQQHLIKIGKNVCDGWEELSKAYDLPLETMGIPPLTTFRFTSENSQVLHTLFTQEMLNRGFLASKNVYASYCHSIQHVEKYLSNAEEVFEIIHQGIEKGNIKSLLKGPVAHEGFKRLT